MKTLLLEQAERLLAIVRWLLLTSVGGVAAGAAASCLLWLLRLGPEKVALLPPALLWLLLPLGGAVAATILHRFAADAPGQSLDNVLAAYRRRDGDIPARTALAKTFATLVSITVGGSAGRTGPAAYLGALVTSLLARVARLSPGDRQLMALAGVAAGFCAATDAPVAAAVFALEVPAAGRASYHALLPVGISSFTAHITARWLRTPTLPVHAFVAPAATPVLALKMVALGLAAGLVAVIYLESLQRGRSAAATLLRHRRLPPWALAAGGGFALVLLAQVCGRAYFGLSLPLLGLALAGRPVPPLAFLAKIAFTSLTLATGFGGGVITPALVIGSTLGSALVGVLHVMPPLAAGAGMAALLGAAANVPVAATLLAFELCGPKAGVLAFCAVLPAYVLAGRRSMFPNQLPALKRLPGLRRAVAESSSKGTDESAPGPDPKK